MSRRIAPRNDRPTHEIEIGYLRDLTISIKCGFYHLDVNEVIHQPIDHIVLSRWTSVHRRNLTECSGYKHQRYTDDLHDYDLKFVDELISLLYQGLLVDNATIAITQEHIDRLERVYRALGLCRDKLVWY